MSNMEKLKRFLNGQYECKSCGNDFHLYAFGYGYCICSDCYDNEHPIIFPDQRYVLNRLLIAFIRQENKELKEIDGK